MPCNVPSLPVGVLDALVPLPKLDLSVSLVLDMLLPEAMLLLVLPDAVAPLVACLPLAIGYVTKKS